MNVRNEIWTLWRAGTYRLQTGNEAERLAGDSWTQELRLSSDESTHYQMVMAMVRFSSGGNSGTSLTRYRGGHKTG